VVKSTQRVRPLRKRARRRETLGNVCSQPACLCRRRGSSFAQATPKRRLRLPAGIEQLEELGERGWLSTVAGCAAEAAYRLGRDDEAWRLTEKAEAAGAADDVLTHLLISQVRAKLLARRGELGAAERMAREAVALVDPTDSLEEKASSRYDLGVVLIAAGRHDEALAALDEARALYDEKGHTVGIAYVEELRSELAGSVAGEAADARPSDRRTPFGGRPGR
jgi:tetratricopeptide (TPR) repeat protein